MKNEKNAPAGDLVFEGMVSIRALLDAIKSGVSDRRITALLYNEERQKKEYEGKRLPLPPWAGAKLSRHPHPQGRDRKEGFGQ